MNKFKEYIEKKKEQANEFLERTKKNITIVERWDKNKEYDERIGEFGRKLFMWNIDEGGYVPYEHLENPNYKYKKPRYVHDPVYQKLAGVRHSKSKIGHHIGAGLTFGDFLMLTDSVIRGLMGKIEDRQMTEQEYTAFLEMPRNELYNHIFKETHKAYQEALKEVGYDANKYRYSFGDDEKFAKLREGSRKAARTLEDRFNIDLSGDYSQTEKKYTLEELEEMNPILVKRAVLLGRLENSINPQSDSFDKNKLERLCELLG